LKTQTASFGRVAGAVLLAGCAVVFISGCASQQGPEPSRAERVFRDMVEQEPDYAEYAFSLVSGAEDPFATALIVEALDSENLGRVRLALQALDDATPPQQAREPLQRVFSTRQGSVKLQAAIALARLEDEQALSWLREQAAEQGGTLSPTALKLLADRGEKALLGPALQPRINSEQLGIRNEAYALLGDIGQPWATQLLVDGLGREFGEERAQAIVSLGQTGDASVAPQIEELIGYQGLVLPSIEALGALGNPSSVKVVKRMAGHEQPLVRAYAGVALCRLGADEAGGATIEPLVVADEPLVRRHLAEQLAVVQSGAATEWLTRLAADDDPEVRAAAVRSLLEHPSDGLEALLLERAEDPDYRVSTVALSGLARVGGPESVPRIEPLLDSENPYVALSAARAILAVGAEAASASSG
jgi:HEAT repeat protein